MLNLFKRKKTIPDSSNNNYKKTLKEGKSLINKTNLLILFIFI